MDFIPFNNGVLHVEHLGSNPYGFSPSAIVKQKSLLSQKNEWMNMYANVKAIFKIILKVAINRRSFALVYLLRYLVSAVPSPEIPIPLEFY